jgi:hypothetical protein
MAVAQTRTTWSSLFRVEKIVVIRQALTLIGKEKSQPFLEGAGF